VDIAQGLVAGKYIKKPYVLEKIGLAVKEELKKSLPFFWFFYHSIFSFLFLLLGQTYHSGLDQTHGGSWCILSNKIGLDRIVITKQEGVKTWLLGIPRMQEIPNGSMERG